MALMYQLPLPLSGKITHIAHISDIHIRDGDMDKSRYNEYLIVFSTFIKNLKELESVKNNSCVTIITGDLFHFKNKLDSLSIRLFNYLILGISEITPLYIIQGNHDFRQDQVDIPDVISSILYGNSNPMIKYLDISGHYIAGDIGFGLVVVRETLKAGNTSGQVEQLQPFPDPSLFPSNIKTKVALFHGTIINSTMQNYTLSPDGHQLSWFRGYKIGVFGDIHLQQIHNTIDEYKWNNHDETICWGYPGSLVQQNFGEPIYGHGYLLWNISNATVSAHHINNQYGLIYAKILFDEWNLLTNSKTIQLVKDFIKESHCPQFLYIIVKGTRDELLVDNLISILHKHNIQFKILKKIFDDPLHDDNLNSLLSADALDMQDYNSLDSLCEYIQQKIDSKHVSFSYEKWPSFIKTPDVLYITKDEIDMLPHLSDSLQKRNKELTKKIDVLCAEQQGIKNKIRSPFKIISISWNWLLCYGADNYINFSNMERKICVINGRNDDGKSSFLEILCIGIFGSGIPSRTNTSFGCSIICNNKPVGDISDVEVHFNIGSDMYSIRRSWYVKQNTAQTRIIRVCKINYDGSSTEIHSGTALVVNDWVKTNIGTLDDFLSSCMMTQNVDHDFFSMKSKTQVEKLDTSLHLESLHTLRSLLKDAHLGYKYLSDNFETKYNSIELNNIQINEPELTTDKLVLNTYLSEYKELKSKFNAIKELWHSHTDTELSMSITNIDLQIIKFAKLSVPLLSKNEAIKLSGELNSKLALIREQLKNPYIISNSTKSCLTQSLINIQNQQIEQPTVSKQYCIAELDKCKSQIIPKISDITQITSHIELMTNRLNEEKIKYASIQNHIPIKSEKTSTEYNLYMTKITSVINAIRNDKLTIDDVIDSIPIQINEQAFNILKQQCENHFKMLINKQYKICSLDIIESDMQQYSSNVSAYTQQLKDLNSDIDLHNQSYNSVQINIQNLIKTIGVHQKNSISKPPLAYDILIKCIDIYNTSLTSITIYKEQFVVINKKIDEYEYLLDQQEKYKDHIAYYSKEIKLIEDCEHPYNSDCFACKQQTWKVQLDTCCKQKQQHENDLSINLATCSKYNDSMYDTFDTLKNIIDKFDADSKHYKTWLNYKHQWELHNQWYANLLSLNSKMDNLEQHRVNYQNDISKLKTDINNISQLLHKNKQLMNDADFALHNRALWDKYAGDAILMQQYNLNKKLINYKTEYVALKDQEIYWCEQNQRMKNYNDWDTQRITITSTINELDKLIDEYNKTLRLINAQEILKTTISQLTHILNQWNIYDKYHNDILIIKYNLLMIEINDNQQIIKSIEEYDFAQQQIQHWSTLKKLIPLYNQKRDLGKIISDKEQLIKQLELKIAILTDQTDQYQKNASTKSKIYDMLTCIRNKRDTLECILNVMSGFKLWLYSTIIIPKLCDSVNNMLESITETSNYQLTCSVVPTSKGDDIDFSWFIKNGANTVIIEKSGGFRKFIAGLAMRIAITSTGSTSIQCRQLFIDEGFVSADKTNLEKIPDFLKSLLSVYNNIIMVAHLDIIKECADISIQIKKHSNNLSCIQHGSIISLTRPAQTSLQLTSTASSISTVINQLQTSATASNTTIIKDPTKCYGKTKAGEQCKLSKTVGNYCKKHNPST